MPFFKPTHNQDLKCSENKLPKKIINAKMIIRDKDS